MSDTDLFKLGARVKFTRPLHRTRPLANLRRKVWEPDPWKNGTYAGIVVGVRTLSDGMTEGWEENTYRPERHYRAVLIATDLHRKPVLVLPENVTAELTELADAARRVL
jgi:hypothetical protein